MTTRREDDGSPTRPILGFELLSDLLDDEEPDLQFLVEPLLTTESLGAVVGPAKSGKSFFLLDTMIGVATGSDVLAAFKVHRPGPVMGVFPEGGRRSVRRRTRAILRSTERDTEDVRFVWVRPRSFDLGDASAVRELRAAVKETEAVLVVLDSVYLMMPGISSSALNEVGSMLQRLSDISGEFGCAILLGHHTNRVQGATGVYRASGAGIAEWSSSFILATPGDRTTVAGTTTFPLACELTARDLPELSFTSTFSMGAADPEDAASDLIYAVSTEVGPSDVAEKQELGWVEGRVLDALRSAGISGRSIRQINDVLALEGKPFKYETIRTALGNLVDANLIDGAEGLWWAGPHPVGTAP
jgi:hypothetical protein